MTEAYSLFSGSSGNSYYIKNNGISVLIDAGKNMRSIKNAVQTCGGELGDVSAIFITHSHSDHISALPVMQKHYTFDIYATLGSAEELYRCNIDPSRVHIISPNEEISVGEIKIIAYSTPHDAKGSVCYRICCGDCDIAVATDIGYVSDNVFKCLFGCSAAVIESNHDVKMLKNGPYPQFLKERILSDRGHLSNERCAALLPRLADSGTKSFLLAHLSKENNEPSLALGLARSALLGKDSCTVKVASPETAVKIV